MSRAVNENVFSAYSASISCINCIIHHDSSEDEEEGILIDIDSLG